MKYSNFALSFIFSFLITAATYYIGKYLNSGLCCDIFDERGFPLTFYRSGGIVGITEWNYFYLVLDIIIWFVISYFILTKFRKKK